MNTTESHSPEVRARAFRMVLTPLVVFTLVLLRAQEKAASPTLAEATGFPCYLRRLWA